jgi:hypothetical protein
VARAGNTQDEWKESYIFFKFYIKLNSYKDKFEVSFHFFFNKAFVSFKSPFPVLKLRCDHEYDGNHDRKYFLFKNILK